jgi:hypothetical protein
MAELRPMYLPPDPASMITGYARWASALLLPTSRAEDLHAGWIAVGSAASHGVSIVSSKLFPSILT